MANTVFRAEMDKWPEDQAVKTHNRWHPDIPIVEWFKPGDEFRVECYDWTGGQIKNDDSANDIRDVDLSKVHYLSGPFGVEGAEPGDLLVVDINDIGWLEDSANGVSPAYSRLKTAAVFSTGTTRNARKACWDFHGVYTTLQAYPGRSLPRHDSPGADRNAAVRRTVGGPGTGREAEAVQHRSGAGTSPARDAARRSWPERRRR